MEIASSLVTASDIQQQTRELCRIKLPGEYDPEHLPKELQKEQGSLEKQMLYYLGQAVSLYQTKGQQLTESWLQWYESAYYHHPSDLIGDPEWENFYPAIVLEDKPYRNFAEAAAATEADQRYLTTQLLGGSLAKKQQERLLSKAQKLVCTLDPREKVFFSEATLDECLQREGLGSNKEINQVLGRKHYTPVTKGDKRDALALLWERRSQRLTMQWQFERGEWDAFELEAVKAFTHLAFRELAQSTLGYCVEEFEIAVWSILAQASDNDNEENHWLDPRDEDTWIGLRDLARAISEQDLDQMHYDYQKEIYTAQQWVKEVGLVTLYGASADWWRNHPDLKKEAEQPETKLEALLIKTNRSPREEVNMYRAIFLDGLAGSEVATLVRKKYSQQIKGLFGHA